MGNNPVEVQDATTLQDEFRVAKSVHVEVGDLVIRPIPGRSHPWAVEVLLDGVKQDRLVGVELHLTIGVSELPRLSLKRILLRERE